MRKNGFYVVLTQIAIVATPLILTPYLTRTIGADGLGVYGFTFGVAAVLGMVGQLGVQLYGRREIARCGDDRRARSRVFWELMTLVWRAFLLVTPVFMGMGFVLAESEILWKAFLWQLLYLASCCFDCSWLYYGVERFRLASMCMLGARLGVLVAVLLLVNGSEDTLLYVGLSAAGFMLSSLVPWVVVRRFVDGPVRADFRSTKHLRHLMNFLLPSVSLQMASSIGVLLVGLWLSVEAVGFYDLSMKLARAPIAFVVAIGVVVFPRASRLAAEGDVQSNDQLLRKGMGLTMFLGVGFAAAMVGGAPVLIPIYAGADFDASILLLQILALSLVTIAWGNVFRTQIILPRGMDSVYSLSLLSGVAVSFVLMLLLMVLLGPSGVALGFVLGELYVAVFQCYAVRKLVPIGSLLVLGSRYVIAGVVTVGAMLGVTLVLNASVLTTGVVLSLVAVSVYTVAVLGLESRSSERIVFDEVARIVPRLR